MPITVVIPALNDEISIGSIVLKTKKFVDHIIVVDYGSTDNTAEIAQLAGADVIIHKRNMGKEEAFNIGFFSARKNGTKIIIAIDIDGDHYIDMIPETINHIKNNNYDVVVNSLNGDKICQYKKNIFSLNKKAYNNTKVELLAFSIEFLERICPNGTTLIYDSIIRNILLYIKKNGVKIKQLDFDKFNSCNIGVVVPAYNEEQLIEKTINGIPKYVKKIYVIDDCSTDSTSNIMKDVKDSRVSYVRHENNAGVGAAIVTGYKLALKDNVDIVAVMAGDNQMDPEQLPHLIMPIIEDKADYTKGNRLISHDFRHGMSKWRFFGNAMLTMITKIGSGYWHITDPQNGYTAISRQALETINIDSIYTYYGYCNDMLIKLNTFGMRVEDVVMPSRYGNEKSKIKYGRYIIKVAPMIFRGFLWRLKIKYMVLDFHPLVFFYLASMILLPFGGLFSFWILYQKLYHNPVSQNYPLLAVFTILIGLQLLLFAMFFDMQADKANSTL